MTDYKDSFGPSMAQKTSAEHKELCSLCVTQGGSVQEPPSNWRSTGRAMRPVSTITLRHRSLRRQ